MKYNYKIKLKDYIYAIITGSIIAGMLTILTSCEEDIMVDDYETIIIPKGKHNSNFVIQSLQSQTLSFTAIFDKSAIYKTQTLENQHDINKLIGFSDCNAHHHTNSARFGWRWLNDQLEIHAYVYCEGNRISKYIGSVALDQPFDYQLRIRANSYEFTIEDGNSVSIPRISHCDKGLYYMLYPYFGGNEKAPHDINIKIKWNY